MQDLEEKEEVEEDVKGQTGGSKTTGETNHLLSGHVRKNTQTHTHTHTHVHTCPWHFLLPNTDTGQQSQG